MAKTGVHTMTKKVLPTLVTFLLDRSSSMGAIWDDTIDGFNAYLKTLQKEGAGAIKFTRLQFDQHLTPGASIQKDCVAEPVAGVAPLDKRSYQPRGSTPLIDAAYKTVEAVEASLAKFDVKHNVIVCIQTDGEENCSIDHSWEGLKELIETKTKAGWVFNFMGTGIDAYAQGSRMGIAAANTMSTGTSREHVAASYASMGTANMRYAATADASLSAFNAAERSASGEHTIVGPGPSILRPATSAPLDLTTGGGTGSSSGTLDLAP
jgi:hypothetical protein